jgi:hypothetical protein
MVTGSFDPFDGNATEGLHPSVRVALGPGAGWLGSQPGVPTGPRWEAGPPKRLTELKKPVALPDTATTSAPEEPADPPSRVATTAVSTAVAARITSSSGLRPTAVASLLIG